VISNSEAEVLSLSIGVALVHLLCFLDSQLTTCLHLVNVMKSLREGQGLFVCGMVGIDRVIAIVRIKRGHANRWMEVVVIGEFSGV